MRILASFPSALLTLCILNGLITTETCANDKITIDGTARMSEISTELEKAYQNQHPNLTIVSNFSGTGGGFHSFYRQEIDINRAARKINPRELEKLATLNISFLELPIARSKDQNETLYFYVLRDSLQKEAIREFLTFVVSKDAQTLITKHGQSLASDQLKKSRELLEQRLKPFRPE
ncbi:MAG: hypothetical protein HUJ26_09270 [Planctomycetaceae bacterium]|nr:hypothetical protein [Planctomycetaceae bacterium]